VTAGMAPSFLTSTLNGGAPAAVLPGKSPDTRGVGGLWGPRGGLDVLEKRKTYSPCRDSNPRSSSS